MIQRKTRKSPKILKFLETVKKHVEDGRYVETKHFSDQANDRKIPLPELLYVLKHGRHEKIKDVFDEKSKDWHYSIRGMSKSDRDIRVIVVVDESQVIFITAIEVKPF